MADANGINNHTDQQTRFSLAEATDIVLAHMDTIEKADIVMTPRKDLKNFDATIGPWIMEILDEEQAAKGLYTEQYWLPIIEAIWDRLHSVERE
jgi:hypothetical protein